MGVAEFFTVSEGATPKDEVHLHVHHRAMGYMVTVGGAGNTPKGERYTHALSYRTDWPALCVSHGSDLAWVYPSVSMVRLDMGPCTSSRPRRIRHRDCGWGCRLPTFYSTTEVPTSWEVLHLHLPCVWGEGCRLYPFTSLVQRRFGCSNYVSDCPLP